MAAANTIGNPLSFTLFPQLPSELRCLIWEKALPPQPSTMMYRYRARSEIWKVRPVVPSDGDLYDENKQDNTILEFQNANVGDKVFDLPTACVNKEARAVTLAWTRDFGIVWKKNIGFAKCFDPSSDVLYVETDSWEDFFEEPMDTVAGEEDKLVAISSQVTQIAIHQDLLFQKLLSVLPANFDLMLDSYDSLRVFIIILDDPIEAAGSYPRTTSADLREEVPLRIPSNCYKHPVWSIPRKANFDTLGSATGSVSK
ncbi:hypothetical protein K461DRAFT_271467 [Myriangium duriaei CBS 260.36]|uniref:2EXR domain-containing protein n=1 Tax=Myriangium duriaei CBS 260.36 TaxID=1168546 RepID=A0A9P4MDG4_9PEZI|nr:hypothetical protein K461DRAFT_271467 [Myriangium duriaei CBS 260.36]